MFGVILWNDQISNRAVIWCEDHGDLAFLNSSVLQGHNVCKIEAGDLVQFDIADDGNMRLATNAQLVQPDAYPQLASSLKTVQDPKKAMEIETGQTGGAKVIPFGTPRKLRASKGPAIPGGQQLRSV
ncbi:hypothetical protein [Roseovarius sp. EL26]|uniref:hypothetical protein n=1 Tax=Roseovarius sp. EL26 TaxID=2126672 RepID=UPI000EA31207|nr:hypothetical protein [Roseovarius sp. EL26]